MCDVLLVWTYMESWWHPVRMYVYKSAVQKVCTCVTSYKSVHMWRFTSLYMRDVLQVCTYVTSCTNSNNWPYHNTEYRSIFSNFASSPCHTFFSRRSSGPSFIVRSTEPSGCMDCVSEREGQEVSFNAQHSLHLFNVQIAWQHSWQTDGRSNRNLLLRSIIYRGTHTILPLIVSHIPSQLQRNRQHNRKYPLNSCHGNISNTRIHSITHRQLEITKRTQAAYIHKEDTDIL